MQQCQVNFLSNYRFPCFDPSEWCIKNGLLSGDLNPRPFSHESSALTTRPRHLAYFFTLNIVFFKNIILTIKSEAFFKHLLQNCISWKTSVSKPLKLIWCLTKTIFYVKYKGRVKLTDTGNTKTIRIKKTTNQNFNFKKMISNHLKMLLHLSGWRIERKGLATLADLSIWRIEIK